MRVMITQFGQLHERLSQNGSSLTGPKQSFDRAFLSSGGNSTTTAPAFSLLTDIQLMWRRVIGRSGARNVILMKLVVHSSHLVPQLDLCIFGLFKILISKKDKVKE
jgi:hypothetical protein